VSPYLSRASLVALYRVGPSYVSPDRRLSLEEAGQFIACPLLSTALCLLEV
jgi:hypothetical protein